MLKTKLLHIILALFLIGLFQTSSYAEVKFKDNVVRVSPNFGTGSTAEAITRIMAGFIAKTLPGQPQVIVEPISGGGGTKLAKQLLDEKGDGDRAGVVAILHLTASLGRPMPLKIENLKNVGSFAFPNMTMVREELGLRNLQDVLNYEEELIIAADKPNAPGIAPLRAWMIANNVKHRVVGGYEGQPQAIAALQSGEVDITPLNSTLYMPMRKTYQENGAIPLVQSGLVDPAGGPDIKVDIPGMDVMSLDEAWKKYTPETVGSEGYKAFRFMQTAFPMVFHWAMAPTTSDEYLEAWRIAFLKMFETDEFKKYLKDTDSPKPVVLSGEQVDETVKVLVEARTDEAIQTFVKELMKSEL